MMRRGSHSEGNTAECQGGSALWSLGALAELAHGPTPSPPDIYCWSLVLLLEWCDECNSVIDTYICVCVCIYVNGREG